MLTIAKLFGKSPFAPLQTHMDKVASCIKELPHLFTAIAKQDSESIERISCQISKREHEADLTKNDIRNHLPKSLFLPIERPALLEILSLQDALADHAEQMAFHACLHPLEFFADFESDFIAFSEKTIEVFWLARQTLQELDELFECSFGGIEAEKVKSMVEQIAYGEYQSDQMKNQLLRKIYKQGKTMSPPAFHIWLTIVEDIGALAHLSEKLGNRIRMLLELK